ncbi:MAG TPA: VOC family protein [Sporichthyaceae bacterium]|nr:VOC family protein [Sporichthyaceae bacterium]
MSAKPKLAHVVFQTGQLEAMRSWYCTLLDAHTVFEGFGLSFITYDEEHHRIAFIQPPIPLDSKTPVTAAMHHTAFTFPDLDSLLERYAALKEQGICPAVPIQHGVTTSLYYRDPDGNFVEMQIDNFDTAAAATAYMEGPEYGANPVGVGFLPDLMIEERAKGTPVEALLTRSWALETSPDLPNPLAALTS